MRERVALLVGLCGIAPLACAQTLTWDGQCAQNRWGTDCGGTTNWDPDQIPFENDAVAIMSGDVVSAYFDNRARSVTQLSGSFTISASSQLRLTEASLFDELTVGGRLICDAPVVVSGGGSLTRQLYGSGPYSLNGTFTLDSEAIVGDATGTNPTTVENRGALEVRHVGIGPNSVIVNEGGRTARLYTYGLGTVTGTGTFRNSGNIVVDSEIGTVSSAFELNAGQVSVVNTGSLVLSGLSTLNGGSILLDNGSLLLNGAAVLAGSSVSGNGTMTLASQSAAAQVTQSTMVDVTGGGLRLQTGAMEIASNKTFTNAGLAIWSSYPVRGGGTFENTGSLFVNSGTLETELTNGDDMVIGVNAFLSMVENARVFNDGLLQIIGGRVNGTAERELVNRSELRILRDPMGTGQTESIISAKLVGGGGSKVVLEPETRLQLTGGADLIGLGGPTTFEIPADSELEFFRGTITAGDGEHLFDRAGSGFFQEDLIISGSTVDVQGGAVIDLECITTLRNAGPTKFHAMGAGTIRNRGIMGWTGGIIECSVENPTGQMIISGSGAIPELRSTITSGPGFFLIVRHTLDMTSGSLIDAHLLHLGDTSSLSVIRGAGTVRVTELMICGPGSSSETAAGRCDVELDNQGEVRANTDGTLTLTNVRQIENGRLTGGTWTAQPGGKLIFTQGVTGIDEGVMVVGDGVTLPWLQQVGDVGGYADLRGPTTFGGPLGVRGGGKLRTRSRASFPQGVTNGEPGSAGSEIEQTREERLGGPVIETPLLTNHAVLLPGGRDAAGPFVVEGDVALMDSSTLEIELGGLIPVDQHDAFDITGEIALDGTLAISLLGSFEPAVGESFTVMNAGSITGEFEALEAPVLPSGLAWTVSYTPTAVVLGVEAACYADCDGSGTLDIFDFLCFQDAFVGMTPYADCTGEGSFDIFDFLCFQDAFVAGCP